jgi:hypothetical protein
VREILACDGLPDPSIPVYVNDRIVSAVRAGLARGRELEARDAVAGLCPNCDHRAFMHQKDGCRRRVEITNGKPGWCVCTLTPGDVAGEIARRAGGGTL